MDRERELIKDLTQETINSYENSYRILCKAFKQDIYDLKKEIHDLQKKQEPFKNTKRQSEKKK